MNVYITGMGLACAAGHSRAAFWAAHTAGKSLATARAYSGETLPVAALDAETEAQLQTLAHSRRAYSRLDRATLMGILAARDAATGLPSGAPFDMGVMVGSSRGPTGLWESHFRDFSAHPQGRVNVWASPTTTPGNLASWVAQDLGISGPALSLSMTCSSGLFALGNALAWLRAGMCPAVLAGATEAPLTPFTVAQLRTLRVLADDPTDAFPSRPFGQISGPSPSGGMLLAEGAAMFALVAADSPPAGALARLAAFGAATETIPHAAGITANGQNLELAMRRALAPAPGPIHLVLAHAPGTPQGDAAELSALHRVFGHSLPNVFSHKAIVGHTLGAAGALGVALGIECLHGLDTLAWPYPATLPAAAGPFRRVMVNAVGFGGVAASVVLELP